MKKWQDAFHLAVYAKVGIERVGPRRRRLAPSEYKAHKAAEAALARTLAAERELKSKWRTEIRAEIGVEFSEELTRWKQHCAKGLRHLAGPAGQDVDIARLKNAAKVGLVRCARAQTLNGRRLISKGFQEGKRKLLSIEGLLSQRGNCLFDLDGVQRPALLFMAFQCPRGPQRPLAPAPLAALSCGIMGRAGK